MIAVPSDDPRFWAVPWSPPASLVCVGATEDMITLPSCEASSPAPAPTSASAVLKPVSLRVTSSVASMTTAPALTATSPICATVRGERRAAMRGPSSAKTSIASDSGSRRLPVSNASSPTTTCRYTGMTKKVPIRTSCWPTSVESPARSCVDAQQRRVEQPVSALLGAAPLPGCERPQQREPAEHHERHRREAQRRDLRPVDRRRRARLDEAPYAAAQDREHDHAQAGRRERHADDVELRASLGARRPRDLPAHAAGCRSRPRSRRRTRTATTTRSSPTRRSAGRRRSRPRRSPRAARTPAHARGPRSWRR